MILGLLKEGKVNIDKKLALMYLGESESLYNKTNINFIEGSTNIILDIKSFLNSNNYNDIYFLIHRIKGIACYIGSIELYEYSSYICLKIKNNEYGDIKNDIVIFINYLKEVINYKKEEIKNEEYSKKI